MPKRSRGLTQAAQNFLNAFNMGQEFQDRVARRTREEESIELGKRKQKVDELQTLGAPLEAIEFGQRLSQRKLGKVSGREMVMRDEGTVGPYAEPITPEHKFAAEKYSQFAKKYTGGIQKAPTTTTKAGYKELLQGLAQNAGKTAPSNTTKKYTPPNAARNILIENPDNPQEKRWVDKLTYDSAYSKWTILQQ